MATINSTIPMQSLTAPINQPSLINPLAPINLPAQTVPIAPIEIRPSKTYENRLKEVVNLLEQGSNNTGKKDEKGNNIIDYSNSFLSKILKKVSILTSEKWFIIIDSLVLLISAGINAWMYHELNQLKSKNTSDSIEVPSYLIIVAIGINIISMIMRLFIFRFNVIGAPQAIVQGWSPWLKSFLILGFNLLFQIVIMIILYIYLKSDDSQDIKTKYSIFTGIFAALVLIITVIYYSLSGNTQFEKDREQIREVAQTAAKDILTFMNDKEAGTKKIGELTAERDTYKSQSEKCAIDLNNAKNAVRQLQIASQANANAAALL